MNVYENLQFTETSLGDHDFAKWLRERGAVDNFRHSGGMVEWFNVAGDRVAFAIYDNEKCSRRIFLPTKGK